MQVKLRDVVGLASDVIGVAVADEVGDACRAAALEDALERLQGVLGMQILF